MVTLSFDTVPRMLGAESPLGSWPYRRQVSSLSPVTDAPPSVVGA